MGPSGGNLFDDPKAQALRAAFGEKLVEWTQELVSVGSGLEQDGADYRAGLQQIIARAHKIAGTAASFGYADPRNINAKLCLQRAPHPPGRTSASLPKP